MNRDAEQQNAEIKKLKNHIHHLENILAVMPGNVYWLNRQNVFQGCNDLQAEAAQLASRYNIIGKTNHQMLWADQADVLDAINLEVMETGQPYIMEEEATMANGFGTYLSQKVPLFDENNQVMGVLGVSFDITDRKRIEKELQEAKAKAEIASRAKTDFIRNMEHDIRTPLCGIMSVATYLKSIETHPQKQELLGDLEAASHELLDYLNNILEFSQINKSDHIPSILKTFNLKHLIQKVFNAELPAAKSKSIALSLKYPEEMPAMLTGDKFRLYRILINLISNAIKFTNQGHINVNVSLIHREAEKSLIEIAVEDTGIGIAKEHHELIYDKFTRCDPANRGIYKGTGLGLWIVKQFIHEMGGKIHLESVPEKGSTFTCTLPFSVPLIQEVDALDGF